MSINIWYVICRLFVNFLSNIFYSKVNHHISDSKLLPAVSACLILPPSAPIFLTSPSSSFRVVIVIFMVIGMMMIIVIHSNGDDHHRHDGDHHHQMWWWLSYTVMTMIIRIVTTMALSCDEGWSIIEFIETSSHLWSLK